MGLYTHHKSILPAEGLVPCSDMCGTVIDSNGSTRLKEGARVMSIFIQSHLTGQLKEKDMANGLGLPLPGVLTEYRCFPDASLVGVPEYLTDEEACCLPVATVTAWMAINGTGGVAMAGLQIAHAAGLQTIVTSSSDAKLEKVTKDYGADHVINYRSQPDWEREMLSLTSGEGADIIFENGGARTLRKSFDCVAFGGLINCIGYLSGKEDADGDRLNTNVLALRRNVSLKGIIVGPRDRFEEAVTFYAEKQIHPVVDRVFTFEEARDGLKYLYSGAHFGKVVIKVLP